MNNRLICILWLIAVRCAAGSGEWFPVRLTGMQYPTIATQARITGTVSLRVQLNPDGGVREVAVIAGQPILARAAKTNLRTWKFSTGCQPQEKSKGVALEFRYVFSLKGEVDYRPRTSFAYEHPHVVLVTGEAQRWTPLGRSTPAGHTGRSNP